MPRFLIGDELGSLKSVRYDGREHSVQVDTLRPAGEDKRQAVQRLEIRREGGGENEKVLVASAHADGSAILHNLTGDTLNALHEWREPRLREGQKFIGLALSSSGVFSCTSNGALRYMKTDVAEDTTSHTGVLPMRLTEWNISPDEKGFAYAGEEVELSVWDAEKALSQSASPVRSQTKKRKRGDELLPGELWRAKNLPNDFLGLRQPVRNTSLSYLSQSSPSSIAVGTFAGDVRRYDTRAQRRPVACWEKIGKVGGIVELKAGHHEHELFAADGGCNLYCVDMRNGKIAYGYQGIAGAITSVSSSPGFLASAARDRYVRVHSTLPLAEPGKLQGDKGVVLEKTYFKSIPTAVAWDHTVHRTAIRRDVEKGEPSGDSDEDDDGDEDVWDGMEEVNDEDVRAASKRRKRTR